MEKAYIETVRLLLESAPAIFETPFFAMKGGTAIRACLLNRPRNFAQDLADDWCNTSAATFSESFSERVENS